MEDMITELLPFLLGLLTVLISYYIYKARYTAQNTTETEEKNNIEVIEKPEVAPAPPKLSSKAKKALEKKKETKDTFSHPLLVTTLKGHSNTILDFDFSSSGKYVTSCSDDRSVMLWCVKNIAEKNHKSVRVNVELDHATQVKWSPDDKAFIASVASANVVQVYKVGKKKDGSLSNVDRILEFKKVHNADIINIGIACNGHFIMSCSSDTTLIIWDLKGHVLATVETLHIKNYYACVSPCGRFVAASGFTPDVRVWEVNFNKLGEFKEVKRAFELKGHSSGVYQFSFSNDSSRMATISKDGTWKLWDTNIDYKKGQEPYLLSTCDHKSGANSLITLSSDGRTVAIATDSNIFVYSAITNSLQTNISNIHSEPIQVLVFSPDSMHLVAAAGRYIRIFENISGYRDQILALKEALKSAASASTKERLQSQIEEAKASLKSLESRLQN